jgi:hypothetical protein
MPDSRRGWTDDDIARLKSLAGTTPAQDVAAQLGRSLGATAVEASKLKLSLRFSRREQRPGIDEPAAPTNP